jgi:hypothetical protein
MALQRRTAALAIGASTVRGAGRAGTARAARAFFAALKLSNFAVSTQRRFRNRLDRETKALLRALPPKARHWGLARKILNIFLRDCLYNTILSNAYQLHAIEQWLEVPLDSHVGKRLHAESPTGIPRWTTIKGLTPELSDMYQFAARTIAAMRGIAPIHLDVFYWRNHG